MKDIRNDLKAYLDNELDTQHTEQVKTAIENNPDLCEQAKDFSLITESLTSLSPAFQVKGVERALERIARPQRSWIWRSLTAASAAVAILTAVFVLPNIMENIQQETVKQIALPERATPPETSLGSSAGSETFQDKEETASSGAPTTDGHKPRGYIIQPSIIKEADLTVRVESSEKAEKEIQKMAKQIGGFIEDSNFDSDNNASASSSIRLRVPVMKFDDAIARIATLGEVQSKNIRGKDITAQNVDLEARLKNITAQEERYRQILREAKRVGEIIEIQDRLVEVRSEIESMQSQQKTLLQLAEYSTIAVTFIQRPKADNIGPIGWLEDTWTNAITGLTYVIRSIVTIFIWIFVFAPFWLLPLIIYKIIKTYMQKRTVQQNAN